MPFEFQLREQKRLGAYPVNVTFTKSAASVLKIEDWTAGTLGHGYAFATFDRAFLNGKTIGIRWKSSKSGPGATPQSVLIYDGSYDRTSDADFPDPGAGPTPKGNGLLQTVFSHVPPFAWTEEEAVVNVAGGSEDDVTVFISMYDAHASTLYNIEIDWVKILENSDELCIEDFTDAVVMEQTGTDKDYGTISTGTCEAPPPPPPPTGHPKIELRFTNVDPPAKEPHRTIYRDRESLPDPMLLGLTIRYFNYDSINLYFRITGSAAGYTFDDVALGLLGPGTNAYKDLEHFASRAKPGAALTEFIGVILTAYTDVGYTNLQWTYTRVCSVVIIDSTDGSWTQDELDNFDDGTIQGWAVTNELGNVGGLPTITVVNDFVLSPPWAVMMKQRKDVASARARLWKQFTTPDKNQVYAIINWRISDNDHAVVGHKYLEMRRDAIILIYLGTTAGGLTVDQLPTLDWKRTVFPLLRDTILEVQIAHHWTSNPFVREAYLWMDDFKIISKD